MQIVLSKKEVEAGRTLLRAISPEIEKDVPKAIKTHPLLTPRTDCCHGEVACDISEELVVSVTELLADNSAVIVPLSKGLYAAAKGAFSKLSENINTLVKEAKERREAADKANADIQKGNDLIDRGKRALCATQYPECAQLHGCLEKGCQKHC